MSWILFRDLSENLEFIHYHSWIIDTDVPCILQSTFTDEEGEIMSLQHRTLDVKGVQFHPESILITHVKVMLKNLITH
ncbi:hypothetical protein FLAN108750_00935 [Flavobacterium antarcticum]|uniref:glutamine amidotransferase-related protein n=1 Tax=Flavobacterium antarcticum TaxID=271155 RepID=UPI000418C68D|nr:hypothetical protein [Flavobacterium antarcticum]